METQEAKEISDLMSRIQAKGKDGKRESTSGPYDSLYLMDNDAIPDTPRRQTENVGTNGSEIYSSSPWAPLPRAILTPRQYAPSLIMPRSPWASTQIAPDLAGEFARNVPSFRQLVVHSLVNSPEEDEVLQSMLHHSSSGEDSIEPTRRGVPGPPKFEEASQFLEATSTTTQENANEGFWKPMCRRAWTYDSTINPFFSSLWETEEVQFQYQDPPQTLSKPQDNGANSRGRILAQRRKKCSPGKKTSMVVRNEFPAFLPWLDRKGFRDMGVKRDHMRDIFDEEEFEVEAHRKLEL
jgi:hypothetical protein